MTDRFSCGYGDLPVSTQKAFLQVVDAERKIGLHVSESCMLVPEKSVTAIIGIAENSTASYRSRMSRMCIERTL